MLFDCGDEAESGELTSQGVLCSSCADKARYEARNRNPSSTQTWYEKETEREVTRLRKRLPHEWPEERIRFYARRLVFNKERGLRSRPRLISDKGE